MVSGANPAAVRSSRKGVESCSNGGAPGRDLSLPTQVSTTMRMPADSITSECMDKRMRPSSVTKSGRSQS